MFAVFSYIAATVTEVTGLPAGFVPVVLALFGVGMIVGNSLGSRLADRSLMRTIGGLLAFNIVVLIAVRADRAAPGDALPLRVPDRHQRRAGPALQTRLMDVAGDAQTLAAASNHSAFNIAKRSAPGSAGWRSPPAWAGRRPAGSAPGSDRGRARRCSRCRTALDRS